jgi:hypothetical protein
MGSHAEIRELEAMLKALCNQQLDQGTIGGVAEE